MQLAKELGEMVTKLAEHPETESIRIGKFWRDYDLMIPIEKMQNAPGEPASLAPARGSAANIEFERSLILCLTEIVMVLEYQPDIPMQHKKDLAQSLDRFLKSSEAKQQQNESSSPTPGELGK